MGIMGLRGAFVQYRKNLAGAADLPSKILLAFGFKWVHKGARRVAVE